MNDLQFSPEQVDSGAHSFLQHPSAANSDISPPHIRVTRTHTLLHKKLRPSKTKCKSTKKLVNTTEESQHIYRMYRTAAAVPVWASSPRPLINGKDPPAVRQEESP